MAYERHKKGGKNPEAYRGMMRRIEVRLDRRHAARSGDVV